MGWTGGYCVVALLLAPYLRRFGQYTIPDFLGSRYGSHWPRVMGVVAAILCSFTYVVAQIYAIGLITSHLTGVVLEIGVFLGLGGRAGVLLPRRHARGHLDAVAQYIVIIVAFLVPVFWLSIEQTGSPLPQASTARSWRRSRNASRPCGSTQRARSHFPAESACRRIRIQSF